MNSIKARIDKGFEGRAVFRILALCVLLSLFGCAAPDFDSSDYQSWRLQQDERMNDWWHNNP